MALAVKNPPANAGGMRDAGITPGSGGSPGGGHGPLQYPYLENPMDRGAWWTSLWGGKKSDTTEATAHTCPFEKDTLTKNYGEVSPHTGLNGIIKMATNNKCNRGYGEIGTLLHCGREWKLVQPLWETVWSIFRKLKVESPYNPEIPHPGVYSDKTLIQKGACTPVFTAVLFTTAATWKQLTCP